MPVDVARGVGVGRVVGVGDAGPPSHAATITPNRPMSSIGLSRRRRAMLGPVARTVRDNDIVTLQQYEKQDEIGRRSVSGTLLVMTTWHCGPMAGEARDGLYHNAMGRFEEAPREPLRGGER